MKTVSRSKYGPGKGLLICFYGDDFTGSTDALESLSIAGVRTVLFASPPGADQLAEYPALEAVGVAGMTRSMRPEEMRKELRPALLALKELKPRHVHYKVCSTFDSSPNIGSIGGVIDLAWEIFRPDFIPLLVGAPALGRHCVFGNLFARAGKDGEPVGLDQHPTMSRHPVTPMDESDLRIHLARQTKKRIALFDVLKLALPARQTQTAFKAILQNKPDVVLFDVLHEQQLALLGKLIDSRASGRTPLFSVGSSGLGMALARRWQAAGTIRPVKKWPAAGKAPPLLVVSGSCSPVTADQIRWATRNGFAEVALDTVKLSNPTGGAAVEKAAVKKMEKYLASGRSVVIHTSCGPDDSRIAATRCTSREPLGLEVARILRETLRRVKLRRLCLAGGDTSSYVAKGLNIESMEMIARIAPGAPLCRVRAPGSPADGLEVNFKGGQVGGTEYFGRVLEGRQE